MNLHSTTSAILSAVIFNAVIIPLLIPVALKGVKYQPLGADALLRRNLIDLGRRWRHSAFHRDKADRLVILRRCIWWPDGSIYFKDKKTMRNLI